MIPFKEVLLLLESHDWVFFSINEPYRVFYKRGDPRTGLPIVVEVHDKMVSENNVKKLREILEGESEASA